MKCNGCTRDPDEGHVQTLYENAVRIARSRDSPDVALSDFEQIALDFEGLVDLDEVETTIERLRQDPAVARGEKARQRGIRHEDSARQRLVTQMRKMEAAVDDAGRRVGDLRDLRRELEHHVQDTKSEDKHRADAAGRLVAFVTTVGFERGIVAGQNGVLTSLETGSVGLALNMWPMFQRNARHTGRLGIDAGD